MHFYAYNASCLNISTPSGTACVHWMTTWELGKSSALNLTKNELSLGSTTSVAQTIQNLAAIGSERVFNLNMLMHVGHCSSASAFGFGVWVVVASLAWNQSRQVRDLRRSDSAGPPECVSIH